MSNTSNLAQIDDINLKIFDEICAERFKSLNIDCVLTAIIDNVPSDVLPHLALQYHITGNEGWLQTQSDKEKRELIKNSVKMHRFKGTKYALTEILKLLNITGNISEWFEYNGNPFYFKAVLHVLDKSIDEETENRLIALINEYKNERSWLEALNYLLISKSKSHIYSALAAEEIITVQKKDKQ